MALKRPHDCPVATATDALSWAIALLLAAKVGATAILLTADAGAAEPALWWTTKLTPVAAVPLAMMLAARAHDGEGVIVFALLAAFVAVAVPWHIVRRYRPRRAIGG